MKYLLEAPDEEMVEWKEAAATAGVPFAEWLRVAARGLAASLRVKAPSKAEKSGREKKAPASRVKKSECSNAWAHRSGSFCKTCGKTP